MSDEAAGGIDQPPAPPPTFPTDAQCHAQFDLSVSWWGKSEEVEKVQRWVVHALETAFGEERCAVTLVKVRHG